MRKFDLSLRSSRSSYFATFRHQLTILSKTDALDEEKWLNMLGTFVKDWFRYESRSEERRVGKECRSRWTSYHSKKNGPSMSLRAPRHSWASRAQAIVWCTAIVTTSPAL